MTRDEIIQMAREAGTPYVNRHYPGVTSFGFTEDALQRFAALVAKAEREACAKVCDDLWQDDKTAYACREAIRARGNA